MPDLKQRLKVEFENIEKSLAELPTLKPCTEFSKIELAGVSALLHNFYNGIEKILKDILNFKDVDLPSGGSWYRDLVNLSVEKFQAVQRRAGLLFVLTGRCSGHHPRLLLKKRLNSSIPIWLFDIFLFMPTWSIWRLSN